MTKAEMESKLEDAAQSLDKALVEFDAKNYKTAGALIDSAHSTGDEVLTAIEDEADTEELAIILGKLEDLGEVDEWQGLDAEELAATRNAIAEAKEGMEQLDLPEDNPRDEG